MKLNIIFNQLDQINNTTYEICSVNAQTLSKYLKEGLQKKDLDYNSFNSAFNSYNKDTSIDNPPLEIYQYLNFFLLELENGEYVVLDGFRRLLWYNPPNIDIMVRVYKKKNLSDVDILNLLIDLNHFKFFNGEYTDRGFGLSLKLIFDIDIRKFKPSYDGYVKYKENRATFSFNKYSGLTENQRIKTKILNKNFLNDLKFLEKLSQTGYTAMGFEGSSLSWFRTQSEKAADFEKFIEYFNNNKDILTPLFKKIEGKNLDGHTGKAVNSIVEYYENAFKIQLGQEIKKTYEEIKLECKNLVKQFSKNNTYTKLTLLKDFHIEINKLISLYEQGKIPEIKAIVFPPKIGKGHLNPGIHEFDDIFVQKKLYNSTVEIRKTGEGYCINHNLDFSFSTGHITKSFCKLDSRRREGTKDCDVVAFANFNNIKNINNEEHN